MPASTQLDVQTQNADTVADVSHSLDAHELIVGVTTNTATNCLYWPPRCRRRRGRRGFEVLDRVWFEVLDGVGKGPDRVGRSKRGLGDRRRHFDCARMISCAASPKKMPLNFTRI